MRTLYSLFHWFPSGADSVPKGTFGNTWRHFLFLWLGEGVLLASKESCQTFYNAQNNPQQKIVFPKMSIALRLRNLVLQSSLGCEWTHRLKSDVRMVSSPVVCHFRPKTVASIKIMVKKKIMVKIVCVASPRFMDMDDHHHWYFVMFKSRIMLNQF